MEDIGYGSHNAILNLGTLGVVFYLYFIKAVFCIVVLKGLAKINPEKFGKYYEKLYSMLFFSEMLQLMLEGFMEFSTAGYLNIRQPIFTTGAEIMSYYYAMVVIGMMAFAMAIGVMVIYKAKRPEDLNDPEFKKTYGVYYEGIRTTNRLEASFNLMMMVRRVIFLCLAFFT